MRGSMIAAAAMCLGMATAASGQANPSDAQTNAERARNRCPDPWVALALDDAYGKGRWGRGVCAIGLYNGGSWNSYAELVGHVRAAREDARRQDLRLMTSPQVPGHLVVMQGAQAKALLPAAAVRADPASLIGNDSGSLIGVDGATMVAAGGGNLAGLPVAAYSSGYALQGKSNRIRRGTRSIAW